MRAGYNVYTYVSFSSQNISNFMGLKTLQIHCYYRITQEQISSTVIFQALIGNEMVGYRWKEMVTLGEVLNLVTLRDAIIWKI